MNLFSGSEIVTINGKPVKKIYGGFGMGQPAILAKQVAELHGYEVREINQLVNNNLEWFDEGIDILDLKKIIRLSDDLAIIQDDSQHIADIKAFLLEFYTQDALNASNYVYLFSQQGYALLIKLLKSDLAKRIYKQMVREYFGMKAAAEDGNTAGHRTCRVRSLSHIAEDDAALERMFRKRRQMLTGMGFDKREAVVRAVESIGHATGIDLTERLKVRFSELGRNPETSASKPDSRARLHKKDSPGSVSETRSVPHPETKPAPESRIPRSHRGWNLNKRGKNKKGEPIFNLSKKIGGKKRQKYLGVWDQEKADRIIDEMNQEHGLESS